MKIGVVILNYNDFGNTKMCVEHLLKLTTIDSIVVVDNCSTDDSYQKLHELNQKLQGWVLLRTNCNKGYGFGNNYGIHYLRDNTDSEIVCISNPDVIFDDNLVSSIERDFEQDDTWGIISGKQLTPDGEVSPNAFWRKKTFSTEIKYMIRSLSLIRKIAPSRKRHDFIVKSLEGKKEIFEVPVLSGCLFFARLDVMKTIGDFDEGTFLYYEEDILAEKMHREGYAMAIDPKVSFIHFGGGSTKNVLDNASVFSISCRSYKYFAKKYLLDKKYKSIVFNFIFALFWADRSTVYKIRKIMGID